MPAAKASVRVDMNSLSIRSHRAASSSARACLSKKALVLETVEENMMIRTEIKILSPNTKHPNAPTLINVAPGFTVLSDLSLLIRLGMFSIRGRDYY